MLRLSDGTAVSVGFPNEANLRLQQRVPENYSDSANSDFLTCFSKSPDATGLFEPRSRKPALNSPTGRTAS